MRAGSGPAVAAGSRPAGSSDSVDGSTRNFPNTVVVCVGYKNVSRAIQGYAQRIE
jgi:hypothetical protein